MNRTFWSREYFFWNTLVLAGVRGAERIKRKIWARLVQLGGLLLVEHPDGSATIMAIR